MGLIITLSKNKKFLVLTFIPLNTNKTSKNHQKYNFEKIIMSI